MLSYLYNVSKTWITFLSYRRTVHYILSVNIMQVIQIGTDDVNLEKHIKFSMVKNTEVFCFFKFCQTY